LLTVNGHLFFEAVANSKTDQALTCRFAASSPGGKGKIFRNSEIQYFPHMSHATNEKRLIAFIFVDLRASTR